MFQSRKLNKRINKLQERSLRIIYGDYISSFEELLSKDESVTLKEETFAEETFAISRFLAKFAKVCSREIFVIYKSRKFILARKKKVLDSRKSRNLKIYIYRK